MYCSYCGNSNSNDSVVCSTCGASLIPVSQPPVPTQSPYQVNQPYQTYVPPYAGQPLPGDASKNGITVAGFVFSIISVVCCYGSLISLLFGIAGVVLSYLGRTSQKSNLAKAGLIIGIIGIALSILAVILALTNNLNYTFNGQDLQFT